MQRAWVPLFERYRVRLVLNGHDHNYQRFRARGSPTSSTAAGVRASTRCAACPRGYPRRVAARVGHGFLHLTVEPDGVLVQVLDLAGKAIDRFRVT